MSLQGILTVQAASWECLFGPLVAPALQGSFDCVSASRSEAATPLRMTEVSGRLPILPRFWEGGAHLYVWDTAACDFGGTVSSTNCSTILILIGTLYLVFFRTTMRP